MLIKNKGFVLLETIIVMSVLLIGIILLYSNYNKIFINSGKISYYDNAEDIYTAYYAYYNKSGIVTTNDKVVDATNNEVLKNLGVEKIYYIDKDEFSNLYNGESENCVNLDTINCFDGSTIAYLKSIQNKTDVDKCEENDDCLTIVKIKRNNHYYFAKFEAYNLSKDRNSLNYISTLNYEDNGLEVDSTPDANIRYVGANPKNYIKFNGETWRIIGIFNNITVIDEHGNEKQESLIKIIRNEPLGNYSWDSSAQTINGGQGVNEWSAADLMYELNCDGSTYCNSDITDGYLSNLTSGTTTWFNGINNQRTATYNYSNNIKSTSIDKIAKVRWNTNRATHKSSALDTYNEERSTTLINTPADGVTRNITWDGKVALMYPSDFGFASTNITCRNDIGSYDINHYGYCEKDNWLYNNNYQRLFSPHNDSAEFVFIAVSGVSAINYYANEAYTVRPTLFLKANTSISSGTGTQTDPYIVDNVLITENAFSTDSWTTIANNVRNGNTSLYGVGDTKTVTINGTNYTVRVANNSKPSECNGSNFSQTACGFVVEFTDIVEKRQMNSTNTNVGGWPATLLRTYLNNDFYNNLPAELKSIIIDTTVISGHGSTSGETNFTSTDKIYLLSGHEVYEDGTDNLISLSDSAYNNTRQLDYYRGKGTTTSSYSDAIKKYNGSAYYWWLRTANLYGPSFALGVSGNGSWIVSNTKNLDGVSPAFRVG